MQKRFIPFVQVRNNCLLAYEQPELPPNHARNKEGFKKAYSGQVCKGTQKRIRKAVDILLQRNPERMIFNPVVNCSHPFVLGFVTLTISDERNIDTRQGYRMLKEFLRWTTRRNVTDYIWKAEFQRRGQLHYHLTINEFIHYHEIQNTWNKLQKKEGLLDAYAKREGHFNPNSTDVHAVRNVRNFDAYLCKYLAKADQSGKSLNGKVWDCSKSLKKARFSDELDTSTQDKIYMAIEAGTAQRIELDHCTIIKTSKPKELLSPAIAAKYSSWI